jgi:hypothetical protein
VQRDIRETALYRETEALYRSFRRPGSGLIADAMEISAHGQRAVFTGTLIDSGNEAASRVCLTDLTNGDTRVLTFGPNTDRAPKLSPDGKQIAFLSDRRKAGDFQLVAQRPPHPPRRRRARCGPRRRTGRRGEQDGTGRSALAADGRHRG